MIRVLFTLIVMGMCCIGNTVIAQVQTCGNDVPFHQVDLTGQPNGVWVSPNHVRKGQCCDVNETDLCTSFEIILDTAAVALNFEVASGAMPSGALYYQIECGPQVPVGEPICLTGAGPHHITFCKPGNNENTYRITSISDPIFPEDDTIRVGCSQPYKVEGIAGTSISWTSIAPGSPGQYDHYLSCTDCVEPSVTPDDDAPEYIDFRICGYPIADDCGNNLTICDTIRISINDRLSASATPDPATFCNTGPESGVTLTGSATGGKPDYYYIWHSPEGESTGNSFFATNEGTVQLEVRDALYSTACPAEMLDIPVSMIPLPEVSAGPDQTLCATTPQTVLSASVTNATGATWSGGSGSFSPSPDDLEVNYIPSSADLEAGNVTITLTSTGGGNGCPDVSDVVEISFLDTVKAEISYATCFSDGTQNSAITVTPTGGDGTYSVSYDGGANYQAVGDLEHELEQGQIYQVVVKDGLGCLSSPEEITIPSDILLSYDLSEFSGGFNVSCQGASNGNIDLTVTGGTEPYSYSWSNGSAAEDISGLPAGTYVVTVSDANGCQKQQSITLSEPEAIILTLHPTEYPGEVNISCHGESDGAIGSMATGGDSSTYTYSWSGPEGYSSSVDSISLIPTGEYVLIVTDANGCTHTESVTLTQPEELQINLTAHEFSGGYNISCHGADDGSITTSIAGGDATSYKYEWTGPKGFSSTSGDLAGLQSGTYTLSVTDANGCLAVSEITLNQPEEMTISAQTTPYAGGHNISCNGASDGSATATALGGDALSRSFSWTGPNGFTSSDKDLSGISAGEYIVTVSDANNCTAADTVDLTEPEVLTASVSAELYEGGFNVSCHNASDGSIYPEISGGHEAAYAFAWTGPNGFTSGDDTLTGVSAGEYTLTVMDGNSCSATANIKLTEPDGLDVMISAVEYAGGYQVSCNGASDGSITANVSGGDPGSYVHSWNGPEGFTSEDLTISSVRAGTYVLNVSDGNSCTQTASITLNEPEPVASEAEASAYSGDFNISCNDAQDGSVELSVTGGDASSYTFTWSGPEGYSSSEEDISGLDAGVYKYVVADANGCSDSGSVELVQPEDLTLTLSANEYAGGYHVSCHGASDGSVSSTVSGGDTATYSYEWTGPDSFSSTEANISRLAAGTYTVTVTDANGCSKTESIKLEEPDEIVINLTASQFSGNFNISCNGASDGEIDASVSGGDSESYSYSWTGPDGFTSADSSLTSLSAGSYTLTVIDANGCSQSQSIKLHEAEPVAAEPNVSSYSGEFNISCNESSDGAIDLSLSGGVADSYSYSWTGPDGYSSSEEDISGLHAGVYQYVVTDANGCFDSGSVELVHPEDLTLTLSANEYAGGLQISCHGGSDGSVSSIISGGDTATYSYEWTGPDNFSSTEANISGITAGIYILKVSDANGCTETDSVNLDQPDDLVISLYASEFSGGYNVSCSGASDGEIESSVSGGDSESYTYSWTGPDGFSSAETSIASLEAGSYTISVTDANGCTDTESIILTEPKMIQAESQAKVYAGGYNISCHGASDGEINVTLNGGYAESYNYSWTGPDGFSSAEQNISGLQSGTYTFTVADANGCSDSLEATLNQPEPLEVQISPSEYSGGYQISCQGSQDGHLEITATGGDTSSYTFNWTGPEGFTSTEKGLSELKAGTYSVTVTDANGCSVTKEFTLTEPEDIAITLISTSYSGETNLSCNGSGNGAVQTEVAGGDQASYTFSWEGPEGFTSSVKDQNNLKAGLYVLSVQDANGCSALDSIILEEPDPLTVELGSEVYSGGFNISCAGKSDGSINTSVAGGDSSSYTFSWAGPDGFTSTEKELEALPVGSYTVTVTDANGCTASETVLLTQSAPLSSQITGSDYNGSGISCNGFADGTLTADLSGGDSTSYSYSWTGPEEFHSTDEAITELAAGEYVLTATDANGCTVQDTVVLTEPENLSALAESTSDYNSYDISCHGAMDGSIDATVSGGTMPYSYNWSNGSFEEDPEMLEAGMHTVVVTDANNCTANASVSLQEPNLLIAVAEINNVQCNGFSDGSVDLDVQGGVPAYHYSWSTGDETEDLHNISAGQYEVAIEDANGCTDTLTAVLLEESPLVVSSTSADESCAESDDGTATATVSGGIQPYALLWSNGASEYSIDSLQSGNYIITATDANNCTASSEVTINEPDTLVVELTTPLTASGHNVSFNGSEDGELTAIVAGGTEPYTLLWNTGDDAAEIQALSAGNYTILVTDSNGCIATGSIMLSQPMQLDMPTGLSPNNDGRNDLFVIRGIEAYPDNQITVVNRWGNTVFEQRNYMNTWDGRNMNGEILPDGTYFVVLEINNGEIVMKGYVDVRR